MPEAVVVGLANSDLAIRRVRHGQVAKYVDERSAEADGYSPSNARS